MEDKNDVIISLIHALENTTKMLYDLIERQNELSKQQIDVVRYQCQENNKLIKEMWEESKKNK